MSFPTLVTGATGWLGTRLLRALDRGLDDFRELDATRVSDARCLVPAGEDSSQLREAAPHARILVGDLRDRADVDAFCRNAEGGTVYHCAGMIHPAWRTREFHGVNVTGTRNLLESAEAHGVRRVVVVSSSSPLGTNPTRGHWFDEGSPYRPTMRYGLSKMRQERLAAEFHSRGRLETVVIRAPWFYGPFQPRRQTDFFSLIRTGRVPIVGDGGNLRSMAYIDNLCQGLLLAARAPEAGGATFWIADRRPYSMNEVVDTIEGLMEREFGLRVAHRRVRLPAWLGRLARTADAVVQGVGVYIQRLHVLGELDRDIVCSVAAAEASLGYDPRVDLEEGMRRSLRWCIERKIAF